MFVRHQVLDCYLANLSLPFGEKVILFVFDHIFEKVQIRTKRRLKSKPFKQSNRIITYWRKPSRRFSFLLQIDAIAFAIRHRVSCLEIKESYKNRSSQDDVGFRSFPSHPVKAQKGNDKVRHGLIEKVIQYHHNISFLAFDPLLKEGVNLFRRV